MVVVIMGVSGSGKTTIGQRLADTLRWEFVDADSFHSPSNRKKMSAGSPLSEQDRRPWLEALREAIDRWINEGRNVVLACSALTASARRILISNSRSVKLVYLKGPFDLIQARLTRRPRHFMPQGLLASQLDTLEEPADALTIDAGKAPDAITAHIVASLDLTILLDPPHL
ncbi:MAG: gluconokinase [Nitrospirales bacterium]|nr:gluconokinase [Nitrospirales bacterium]